MPNMRVFNWSWKEVEIFSNGSIDQLKLNRCILEIASFFSRSDVGVRKGDPRVSYVTEGRIAGDNQIYNPSPDLAQAILYNLVCLNKDELTFLQMMFVNKCINRTEYNGWRDHVSFSRLRHGSGNAFTRVRYGDHLSIQGASILLSGDKVHERTMIPEHFSINSMTVHQYHDDGSERLGGKSSVAISPGTYEELIVQEIIGGEPKSFRISGYLDIQRWLEETIGYNPEKTVSWRVRVPVELGK